MLGGRSSDVFDRRRVFMFAMAAFGAASLLGGLAHDRWVLPVARANQGGAVAFTIPAALALTSSLIPAGASRERALALFASIGGVGVAIGVVAGGALTSFLTWTSVLLINVPVAAVALIATPRQGPQHGRGPWRDLDLPGAVLVTAGLVMLTWAASLIAAGPSIATIAFFFLSFVVLAAFVVVEAASPKPLMPLGVLRVRAVRSASLCAFACTGTFAAMLVLLSLYTQNVLGLPPVVSGMFFLPLGLTGLAASAYLSPRLSGRLGARNVMMIGLTLPAVGLGIRFATPSGRDI